VPIRYFFLLTTSMWAQFAGHSMIRGELQIEGIETGHDYQVDLADCSGGAPAVRGWLSGNNRFEFDDVAPGCKMLRVVAGPQRAVIQETQLFADGSGVPVTIRIAQPRKEPAKAGTVSAERLRHPIPQKVVRALAEANRQWRDGRAEEAREKLRPAVRQYPDCLELRLNLGVIEMKLGNLAAAAENFSMARELEPRSAIAAVDMGFALLQLHRLEEAERAAKDAVSLEPKNQIASLLLARVQAERLRAKN
jgi:tetratricopeptide (TPR) repeat protein